MNRLFSTKNSPDRAIPGLLAGTAATLGVVTALPAIAVTPMPNQADVVMEQELRLRIIGCGVPGVSRIQIGFEERCTLDIPGQKRYLYDAGTKKLIDPTCSTTVPQPGGNTGTTPPPNPGSGLLASGDVIDGMITANSRTQQATTGVFGQVKVEGPGDEYRFKANAGDSVTIRVTPRDGLQPFLAIVDPSGAQGAGGGQTSLSYTAKSSGTHSVLVIGDRGTIGAYTLRFSGGTSPGSSSGGTEGPKAEQHRSLLAENGLQTVNCPINPIVKPAIVTFHEADRSYSYCVQTGAGFGADDYYYNPVRRRPERDTVVSAVSQSFGLEATANCQSQASFGQVDLTMRQGQDVRRYCAPARRGFAAGSYEILPAQGSSPLQVCRSSGFLGLGKPKCVTGQGANTKNP